MNAHRIETKLSKNGTLTLRDLPFGAGAAVEVIALEAERSENVPANGNGATASTRAVEDSDASQENSESWVESFARECEELCRVYGDAPPDFAATWKQEKGRRIMERNQQP